MSFSLYIFGVTVGIMVFLGSMMSPSHATELWPFLILMYIFIEAAKACRDYE